MSSNLATRIVTGLTMAGVMVACLYYSSISWMLILLLIVFLGIWEYGNLVHQYEFNKHPRPQLENAGMSILGSIIYLIISCISLSLLPPKYIALTIPLLFLLFLKELYAKAPQPFVRLGLNITGILYLAIPFALLNTIASYDGTYNPNRIMGICLLLWANDVMAYFSGRAFGRTPLFKRISPKKTWEGSVGGGLSTLIVAAGLTYFFPEAFPSAMWYGLAVIAALFGSWGDLVESLLKRSIGVKDSGTILPGHGGILDRFDAFLYAVPFMYALIVVMS